MNAPVDITRLLTHNEWAVKLRWVNNPLHLPRVLGVYVLLLQLDKETVIEVGSLGKMLFSSGYYLYVGSAKGPGGLAGRVSRHWLKSKKRHWHVDYLRNAMTLHGGWILPSTEVTECEILQSLIASKCHVLKGMGSSDCHCVGHVIYIR